MDIEKHLYILIHLKYGYPYGYLSKIINKQNKTIQELEFMLDMIKLYINGDNNENCKNYLKDLLDHLNL